MDLEQTAIERLKMATDMSLRLYKRPLMIAYSGGKDSDVLLHIARRAQIPCEVVHSLTTADAPETVRHVRKVFAGLEHDGIKCSIDVHRQPDGTCTTMWGLIPQQGVPPTRLMRYCCAKLKETAGTNRWIATGVRWAESAARKKRGLLENITKNKSERLILMSDNDERRMMMESCQLKGSRAVNPIIDWQTKDVLDYCEEQKIMLNPLYDRGMRRVGCIGCPMAGAARKEQFAMYPKYKDMYMRTFARMLQARKDKGLRTQWETPADVWHWWMDDGVLPGQVTFDEMEVARDGQIDG